MTSTNSPNSCGCAAPSSTGCGRAGSTPYPVTVERTTTLAAVRAAHPDLEPDTMTGERVGVTGRVIFFRNTGKLCFATLREGDAELQVMLSRDRVGEEALAAWKSDVDLGDHVLVTGEVGTSRRGELSVFADSWQLAAKALRPLPVAHKPMSEELRVRRRYVDLIVRDEARRTVRQRATVMSTLRSGLESRGFLEVETPMLQTVHGGAAARPFRTHMNAFDLDLYLRIAPELFLSAASWAGSTACSRSTGTSATKGPTARTRRNSRCWRSTRPTPTTR